MRQPNQVSILVTDDDDFLREAMEVALKGDGYQVVTASSGNQALKVVESQHIDIVLSDVRMPDGNGVDLLRAIRLKDPVHPVVVLVTGYTDFTNEEALEMGARRVFAKPFSFKELVLEMDQIIGYERPKKK